MEEWKDIKGYEGLYQISNKGRVKSLKFNKEKIRKPGKTKDKYLTICLCKNGKQYYYRIHRLVAEAFIPNPDNLPVVNHKDEDKSNNCVENLEWCTREYNNKYGTRVERARKKRKGKGKKILCVETGEIFNTSKDVIDKMLHGKGTSANISMCCTGKRKSAYKYHFKFVE